VQPVRLPPNQLHRFYRGGARIAALRSSGSDDPYAPEEWIASMTSPFGEPGVGFGVLEDGTRLPDAVAAEPGAFLGPDHLDRWGADVAVLIKLLDSGQRLPVHLHPDDDFARAHLGSRYGKTEAWIILEAEPGASIRVGFRDEISAKTVEQWVDDQDVDGMLSALVEVPVSGDETLYVPAGTPHAIGAGILLAELQQPTDLSILLEWTGFADGPAGASLGLGFDRALQALDRSPWGADDLARSMSVRSGERPGVETLFPSDADEFFRAERIKPAPTPLEESFSVLVVIRGRAVLRGDTWDLDLNRGDAVLLPYAAGRCELEGDAEILRCMPPKPKA
jgi:mannose-6-phosphate isomerase